MLAGLRTGTQSKTNGHIVPCAVKLLTTCPIMCSFLPLCDNQGVLMSTSHVPEKRSSASGRRSRKTATPQQSPKEHDNNPEPENRGGWFPKDLKETLDAIQRLTCIGLGIWAFAHTNNYIEFIAIIAIGQVDTRSAKDVIVRIIKAVNVE